VRTREFELLTRGGSVRIEYLDAEGKNLRIGMGRLSFWSGTVGVTGPPREVVDEPMRFGGKEYRCTCVSIGNPHCVIPLDEVSREIVCEIGQYSETAEYFPHRINTQIVKAPDRHNIQIEIYERGAGYTLASGSSSCAAAGAARRLGLTDGSVHVHMPGGVLFIEIDDDWNVCMTGSVTRVGEMELADEALRPE